MKIKKLAYCGLFATLIGAASQIAIPLQPVPINLALLAVVSAGALLGAKYGTFSVIVYILLGAVGMPVFTGFRGGLSVLAGLTGGYIVGYAVTAFVTGVVCQKTQKTLPVFLGMCVGTALCNVIGTAWFCLITGSPVAAAVYACVLPYIPGDILKIIGAIFVFKKFNKHIK